MFSKHCGIVLVILVTFLSLTCSSYSQSWTKTTTILGPPAIRFGHSAVYDSSNNRMIIFGGDNNGTLKNDIWVLSYANGLGGTSAWTEIHPTGSAPTTRIYHSAVYDSAHNRMTIFGGTGGGGIHNDVWVLSNANGLDTATSSWTQLFPTGSAPTSRSAQPGVYDPTSNSMIIFGGACPTFLNDVWVLSNANGLDTTTSTWTQLFPTGSAPTTRAYHVGIYDPASNRMTIHGGGNGVILYDTWVLSNANGQGGTPEWTQLSPLGSEASTIRYLHTAVYDTANNRMTIFGGALSSDLNDVWVLSYANGLVGAPAWTKLLPTGSAPTSRDSHTAIYDTASNRMTIFGGESAAGNLNDVWVLDMANGLPVKDWMDYSTEMDNPRKKY